MLKYKGKSKDELTDDDEREKMRIVAQEALADSQNLRDYTPGQ